MSDDHDGAAGTSGSTQHHARVVPAGVIGAYLLSVVEGPDAGTVVRLDASMPGRSLVGTSEVCAVRLSDVTVSRRHVALEIVAGRLLVVDLESTNGTRVNGVLVERALVEAGATLELGATRIAIQRDERAPVIALPAASAFGRLLGTSVEMRRLFPLFSKLAASTIAVVVEGETGTGKEALAEALHEEGPRRDKPFVVFDCTAVPANLVEAELFGHERGAFTGADRARAGFFREADGGTLFIDEIGDLDPALQPKLLRALDRGEVRPIGGKAAIKVDVRIIAATRRDLDREVQAGRFRDDLFHRLAVGRIELPPLRHRRGDIRALARAFWIAQGGQENALPADLLARWETEAWPGNVRELRNAVSRQLALGELADLDLHGAGVALDQADQLPALFAQLSDLPLAEARVQLLERFEREYVARVLEKTGGNVTQAAVRAGVARRYFHILKAKRTGGSDAP